MEEYTEKQSSIIPCFNKANHVLSIYFRKNNKKCDGISQLEIERTMELKEFVKDTISDISDAIVEINREKSECGLIVNPCKYSPNGARGIKTPDGRLIYEIEFNLSVSISERDTANGKIGISVIGASINGESQSMNISNIRFVIPVAYPRPEK